MSENDTHKITLGTKEEMAVQRLELELSLLLDIKDKPAWLDDRIAKKKRDLEHAKLKLVMSKE